MPVQVINSHKEFTEIINSGKPVIIDFWATWCGPCRVISPVLEKLSDSSEYGAVEFYKVDVDEQAGIAQEVGIRAMPTFIVFKDGIKIDELVGAVPQRLELLVKQGATLV